MKRLNVNMRPSGGYFFVEKDDTKLTSISRKALMREVASYRQRNGFPAGDPMAEILDQECRRVPGQCDSIDQTPPIAEPVVISARTGPPPQDATSPARMKARVLAWLTQMRRDKFQFGKAVPLTSQSDAAERAKICRNCPNNKPISSGCASCQSAMRSFRKGLVGPDRQLAVDLGGCGILGEDLRTSAHLDEIRVDISGLPAHCFRKKL